MTNRLLVLEDKVLVRWLLLGSALLSLVEPEVMLLLSHKSVRLAHQLKMVTPWLIRSWSCQDPVYKLDYHQLQQDVINSECLSNFVENMTFLSTIE